MSKFSIDSNESNYDSYVIEVARILSTAGKKVVDSNGVSLYPEIRYKSQDRWDFEEYISDAYIMAKKEFGKYASIEKKDEEYDGIKYTTMNMSINCPDWFSDTKKKEIYNAITFFVVRYIVGRKLNHLSNKDSERYIEGAKLYLEEAKNIFFTKQAPVRP